VEMMQDLLIEKKDARPSEKDIRSLENQGGRLREQK